MRSGRKNMNKKIRKKDEDDEQETNKREITRKTEEADQVIRGSVQWRGEGKLGKKYEGENVKERYRNRKESVV